MYTVHNNEQLQYNFGGLLDEIQIKTAHPYSDGRIRVDKSVCGKH
jgi:hypothetical protein